MALFPKKVSFRAFKSLLLLMIFVLLIFSETNIVSATFTPETPLFTRSHYLTKPSLNSEPINLNWNGYTTQQIADYYISKGWEAVSRSSLNNVQISFNFNPLSGPIGLYLTVESSGTVWIDESRIGGPVKVNNWNNVTFVKNDSQAAVLSSACFINLAMPFSRDHFRIWQFGQNVIGSATHDYGFESTTATYFQQLVNFYYSLFCGTLVVGLVLNVLSIGKMTALLSIALFNAVVIPVIHYLLINPIASSNGGHMIASYPNGWSSAKRVANDWSNNSNYVSIQYRSTGLSPKWELTSKQQQWNYQSFDMHYTNNTLPFHNLMIKPHDPSNSLFTFIDFFSYLIATFQVSKFSKYAISKIRRMTIKKF